MTHLSTLKLRFALQPGIYSLGLMLFLSACDQQGNNVTTPQGDAQVYNDAVEQFKLSQEAADAEAKRKAEESANQREFDTYKTNLDHEARMAQIEAEKEARLREAEVNQQSADLRSAQSAADAASRVDVARIQAASQDKASSNQLLGSVFGGITSASGQLLGAKWQADANKEAAGIQAQGNKESAQAYAEGQRAVVEEQGKWRYRESLVEAGAEMNANQRQSFVTETAVPAEEKIMALKNHRDESASYAARLNSINDSNVQGISLEEARSLENRYGRQLFEVANEPTPNGGNITKIVGLAKTPSGEPIVSSLAKVESDRAARFDSQFTSAVSDYNENIAPTLQGMGRQPRRFTEAQNLVEGPNLNDEVSAALGERPADPEAEPSSRSATPVTPLSVADRRETVDGVKEQLDKARQELNAKGENDPTRTTLQQQVSTLERQFLDASLGLNQAEQELLQQQVEVASPENKDRLNAQLESLKATERSLREQLELFNSGVAGISPEAPVSQNVPGLIPLTTAPVTTVTNVNTNSVFGSLENGSNGSMKYVPAASAVAGSSIDVYTQESLQAYRNQLTGDLDKAETPEEREEINEKIARVDNQLASLESTIDGFGSGEALFLCQGSGPRECTVDTNGLMAAFNEVVTAKEEIDDLNKKLENDQQNQNLRSQLADAENRLKESQSEIINYLELFNNEASYGHIYKVTAARNSAELINSIIERMNDNRLSDDDIAVLKSGSFDSLVANAEKFGMQPKNVESVQAAAVSQFEGDLASLGYYFQHNPVAGYDAIKPGQDFRGGTSGTPICFRTGCEVQ